MTKEEAKAKADQLLEESAQLLFGVSYDKLDDLKQSQVLVLALQNFTPQQIAMADQMNKEERNNG